MRIAILILTLTLAVAGGLFAQETTTAAAEATTTATTTTSTDTAGTQTTEPAESASRSSYEIRSMFTSLVRNSPTEVGQILAIDPNLVADDAFLVRYPDIAAFVAKYPQIRTHPRFYMAELQPPARGGGIIGDVLESVTIFFIFALVAFALAWLVRTVIEQKRWNKLSRTQAEVHNKILDRFSTSGEVMDYIKTPAGTKFLESAPIPLHEERTSQSQPLTRVMWSVQLGVIVAAASLGMLLVSTRFADDAGKELFAMGVIAFCIGAGFIGSAAVSLFLSRRLGLWQPPHTPDASEDRLQDARLIK